MVRQKMDRDLALQLQAVRQFACTLQTNVPPAETTAETPAEAPAESATELPPVDAETSATLTSEAAPAADGRTTRLLFDAGKYLERLAWLKGRSTSSDGGRAVPIRELQHAIALGSVRRVGSAPTDAALQTVLDSFPHCGPVMEFVRRRCVLARLVHNAPLRLPPILLSGEPGVGKTAFTQRLAQVLDVPLVNIDVATLDTSFKLTGLDAGYSTGKPGLIWDALQQTCMSPIVVLDEIDKLQSLTDGGLGFLLGLLEPSTATRFIDACMGVPLDASAIHWIATCNEPDRIDSALRSRMHMFEIGLPTPAHMPAVIRSVYRGLRESESWGALFSEELGQEVIDALASQPPRAIWQLFSEACANAAADRRCDIQVHDLPPGLHHATSRKVGFV
jgi:ATP-dependent Lon protease